MLWLVSVYFVYFKGQLAEGRMRMPYVAHSVQWMTPLNYNSLAVFFSLFHF